MIATQTKHDIVVFLEGDQDGAAAEALRALGVHQVIDYWGYVKSLDLDLSALWKANEASQESYFHTWDKLLGWSLTSYDKAVLIDSDVLAWRNADELMRFPQLAAAPDGIWPFFSDAYPEMFNAGVLVIEPSRATFEALVAGIASYERPEPLAWETGEQTYLNTHFNASWYHLPVSYNYFAFLLGDVLDRWKAPHGLKLVHHVRESFAAIPASAAACEGSDWYRCAACCKRLVAARDDAMAVLQAAGYDLARIGGRGLGGRQGGEGGSGEGAAHARKGDSARRV